LAGCLLLSFRGCRCSNRSGRFLGSGVAAAALGRRGAAEGGGSHTEADSNGACGSTGDRRPATGDRHRTPPSSPPHPTSQTRVRDCTHGNSNRGSERPHHLDHPIGGIVKRFIALLAIALVSATTIVAQEKTETEEYNTV